MSANWSLPTVSSTYVNFVTELDNRLDDLVMLMDSAYVTATNVPTNAIRWNSTNNYFERWSGAAWAALTSNYAINSSTATTWQTARNLVVSGDGSATFTSVNGSANVTATLTLSTVNSNVGSFGSTSAVPVITVNAKGLITGVTTAALASMATQAANNVAITGGSISGVNFRVLNGTGSTTEGILQWNNTSDLLTIGTGAATKTFVDTNSTQTLSGKTLTSPIINTPTLTLSGTTSTVAGVLAHASGILKIGTGTVTKTIVDTDSTQTLSGKTFTSPVISTISNTGTLTLPTSTDTLVGRATTDTLTNKTLSSPTFSGTPSGNSVSDGDKGDITVSAGVWTADPTIITGKTEDVAPDPSNDYLLAYDASASALKKVLMTRVGGGGYDEQVFTASGTWTKPTAAPSTAIVIIEAIGGGGSGGRAGSSYGGGGGGGGAYLERVLVLSQISETAVSVTVGAGGAAVTVNNTVGNDGGTSSFGSYHSVYGGGGGAKQTNGASGGRGRTLGTGGGGCRLLESATEGIDDSTGGDSLYGGYAALRYSNTAPKSTGGAGVGTNSQYILISGASGPPAGASSMYGGGGGGGEAGGTSGAGGSTIYGGGGGGGGSGSGTPGAGGTSVYGGAGGAGATGTAAATAGSYPGGGGGGSETGNSGAGGDGKVTVRVIW